MTAPNRLACCVPENITRRVYSSVISHQQCWMALFNCSRVIIWCPNNFFTIFHIFMGFNQVSLQANPDIWSHYQWTISLLFFTEHGSARSCWKIKSPKWSPTAKIKKLVWHFLIDDCIHGAFEKTEGIHTSGWQDSLHHNVLRILNTLLDTVSQVGLFSVFHQTLRPSLISKWNSEIGLGEHDWWLVFLCPIPSCSTPTETSLSFGIEQWLHSRNSWLESKLCQSATHCSFTTCSIHMGDLGSWKTAAIE